MKVKCISAVEFSICDTCTHQEEHEKDTMCDLTYCVNSNLVKVLCLPLDEEQKRNL